MNLLQPFQRAMQLFQQLKRIDSWMAVNIFHASLEEYRLNLLKEERYKDPLRLNRFEHQVFSQNGEDGIIAEIFRRIGVESKRFIEIGVGNGLENNTTFLLLQGWTGAWLDGDKKAVSFIQEHFQRVIREDKLRVASEFITAENILDLVKQMGVGKEFDLVSIDIDRNTYWILAALLKAIRARVLVVEYNGIIPPDVEWKVDYDPKRVWNKTSYMSASLKAYENLCRQHSYSLVGCELCGVNAFFVRDDLCGEKFARPLNSENHYEPLRDYLVHHIGPERSFTDMEQK